MKAQFIKENIDFQRGKDPKEAMDVGYKKRIYDILYKRLGNSTQMETYKLDIFYPLVLSELVSHGDVDLVRWWCEKSSKKPTGFDFSFAVKHQNLEMIKTLIELGTPKHHIRLEIENAGELGNKEIVKFLLDIGVQPMKDSYYNTNITDDEIIDMIWDKSTWNPKNIFENIDFQRGKDPKKTMRIGTEVRTLKPYEITNSKYFVYNWDEIKKILHQIEHSDGREMQDIVEDDIFFIIDVEGSDWDDEYSLEELRNPNSEFDFIEWEGKKIPILKHNINESIKFERGKDPRVSMDIGMKQKSAEIESITHWDKGVISEESWPKILENLNYKIVEDYYITYRVNGSAHPAINSIKDILEKKPYIFQTNDIQYFYYDGEYYKIPFNDES